VMRRIDVLAPGWHCEFCLIVPVQLPVTLMHDHELYYALAAAHS